MYKVKEKIGFSFSINMSQSVAVQTDAIKNRGNLLIFSLKSFRNVNNIKFNFEAIKQTQL